MNNTINQLNQELKQLGSKRDDIEAKLQAEYNKLFNADEILHAALRALESSNDYTLEDFEVWQWVRFDLAEYTPVLKYLDNYLSDYGIQLDKQNDVLILSCSPSIIINEDGDVYDEDSQKWIVSEDDYRTRDERNQLIEAYMERTSCYPGVFEVGRYGDVTLVNTQKKGA